MMHSMNILKHLLRFTKNLSFLFSITFIFISSSLYALSTHQLAKKIQAAYEGTQNLEITFEQETYVALLEKKVKKKGKMALKKPGKFKIIYAGKRGRHYYNDGKTLWIWQAGDHQAQKVNLGKEEIPAEALSFLTGLGKLNQEFAVESVDPEKWKNFKRKPDDLHWLELTPLKKKSQIKWIVMGFDPSTFLAREFYLLNEGGNLTHYFFKEIQKPAELSDEIFKFKKSI